jgi:hypothetical protein
MRRTLLCISLLAPLGCTELEDDPSQPGSGDEVFVEWDHSADFTAFASFAFIEPTEDEPEVVTLNVTRVRNAVRAEYELLGLVEAENADVDVVILTETETSSNLELDCVPAIYWSGNTGGYNSCALLELEKHDVTVGTILLGIGDAARGEIVFNGMMQGIANGQDTEHRINDAVGEVFDEYPADQTGM